MKFLKITLSAVCFLLLYGCAIKGTQQYAGDNPNVTNKEYVNFDFESYKLNDAAKIQADRIAHVLVEDDDQKINIIGFTNLATEANIYNFNLREKRALVLRDYLLSKGVEANQLCHIHQNQIEKPSSQNDKMVDEIDYVKSCSV